LVEVASKPGEWNPRSVENIESQRYKLVAALKDCGVPLCDRALSELTGLPVNLVNARRSELVEVGRVRFCFKAKSPFSNVRVKHWGLRYGC